MSLETIVVESQPNCDAAIIWLHGLGADGHDFAGIVPEIALPKEHKIRFIFPHAPLRPVTLNQGMSMRAWFDIIAIHPQAPQDLAGLESARAAINQLIEQQHLAGIPYNRIALTGFSQGGALALHAGLRFSQRLAGIMALSTFLPLFNELAENLAPANRDLPILMTHGLYDTVLPLLFGQLSKDVLVRAGLPLEWKTYPMGHEVCGQEITDIRNWLIQNM